jgi:hypothetical protein
LTEFRPLHGGIHDASTTIARRIFDRIIIQLAEDSSFAMCEERMRHSDVHGFIWFDKGFSG